MLRSVGPNLTELSDATKPTPAALSGARVAFVGRLATISRRQAARAVRDAGGQTTSVVTARTTHVVVGEYGWPLTDDGSTSPKLRAVLDRARRTGQPAVLAERDFARLLGVAGQPLRLDAARLAERLGVSRDLVERLARDGLLHARDGQFDFRDMVSLQTLARLLREGAKPETIRRGLLALQELLPDASQPLAQLRLVLDHPRSLVAELEHCRIDATGQLLLRFDDDGIAAPEPSQTIPFASPAAENADEWHALACAYEEQERYDAAIDAYRRAIALRPDWPDAFFNLGNALCSAGRGEAATEMYRLCSAMDPTHAETLYNLANVLDDRGDVAGAIDALERALRINPAYADAHYNLALCLERAGRFAEARERWRAYLRLDPSSQWSDTARRRLATLGGAGA